MMSTSRVGRSRTWFLAALLPVLGGAALVATGCGHTTTSTPVTTAAAPMMVVDVMPPAPDPRVGLKAGIQDAGEAIWNLQMVSHTPPPPSFDGITNSDLAFTGKYVIQGNYNGFQIWDVSDPAAPSLVDADLCPASQSDVSVYRNLLFVSAEAPSARLDCGAQAPRATVSKDRIRGLRIFDITDIRHPKYIANVQTCRGSHTHTVVTDPSDKADVFVYISGTAQVRPDSELPGCVANPDDPNTALFRIEVIRIPLAHPEQAAIVSSPRIFASGTGELVNPGSHGASPADTGANGRGRRGGRGGRGAIVPLTATSTAADTQRFQRATALATLGQLTATSTHADTLRYNKTADSLRALGITIPNFGARGRGGFTVPRGTLTQCHDITVYPTMGLAGGACAGMGLLLDIHDAAHPKRIDAVADSNFSFWHSATFSNDGSMILFSDEWGGGSAPYCRAADPKNWGADAIFTIVDGKMKFQSYYKMPAAQTEFENCVAHNGSLIPIPGRTVMVQAWYQGGLSIFDWTNPAHPTEIGYFDRGPNDSTRLVDGGFWSVYWYNGFIVGSEIRRGLDIFQLRPSAAISQNEIDAAQTVHLDQLNVQDQPHFVWPASFALSGAYLDQLERGHGLSSQQVSSVRGALAAAQGMSGSARSAALKKLAGEVKGYTMASSDPGRVGWLANSVTELAGK